MKKETMEALKFEEEQLVKKIKVSSEKGEFGTYKNLVQALERILYLQERFQENFRTMWSKYRMVKEGKEIDAISVWEQCGEKIKSQRVFEIKEEILSNEYIFDITDYVLSIGKYWDEYKQIHIKGDIYDKYLKEIILEGYNVKYNNEIYSVDSIRHNSEFSLDGVCIFLK